MKISLLFPPTWHPSQPYLNLPSLTRFLAQGDVTIVSQQNLGIEILSNVASQSYEAGLYQEIESDRRIEYTVIDDPVNVSSRLRARRARARGSPRRPSVQRSVSCPRSSHCHLRNSRERARNLPVFCVKR